MPKRPLFLLALTLALGSSALAADDATPYIRARAGLGNSFRAFASSQQTQAFTKISYFGGSITAGAGASKPEKCYRALLHQHLREQFPGATLADQNASLGGTGSWLGAFRTRNQALYGGAALVIVEFAVNDGGSPEAQVIASMDGIVRQIWQTAPTTDILFVYTMVKQHMDAYKNGQLPATVQWHERVAEHYGIPSVNMAAHAAKRILAGELTFDEFARDGVHPTDRGYALYMDALKPFVAESKASAGDATAKPRRRTLPKPLSPAPMEKAQCVPYEWVKREGEWNPGRRSGSDAFLHVLESDKPGAALTLRFKGSQCGYFNQIGVDTGDLEVSVDGRPWEPRADWDQYCKNSSRPHARTLATGLDPTQWHDVRVRIAERQPPDSKGRFQRIGYLLADGEVADPLAGLEPLPRLDAVWDQIRRPLKMNLAPRPDRWAQIPDAMRKLRDGGTLRIALLGDSIMGDTSSSQFELLLGRMYDNSKIEKVLSNRGSTGCWWYKDENRVEDFVVKHRPDLLMIGGISQRNDIESIRVVIHQVRERLPACEFLLMTPAFGADTDAHIKNWRYDIDPNLDDYRARLQKLAADERCGFLDMTGPWWQFVLDSGCDYGYFRRDRVHANERGYQILGRIIERYFAPEPPKAKTDAR